MSSTWKRHFSTTSIANTSGSMSLFSQHNQSPSDASNANFVSFLPEVYSGAPNRIERYTQFEQMDLDPVINAALNTIAEFSTQEDGYTKLPFTIEFTSSDATELEKETLEEAMKKWCYLNDFRTKLFHIVRKVILYGDCFFVRDPETYEWYYVDPKNVEKCVVDELKGKEPESYFMRDLDLNVTAKVMSTAKDRARFFVPSGLPTPGNPNYPGQNTWSHPSSNSRFSNNINTTEVPGSHVIHLSLNTGLEQFWPFGTGLLEPVFKVHKQKDLLEESMVIYRVQRAPERRVFKFYTGTLPVHKAMQFVERMKNEIQQRRIPSRTGGGSAIMDASYNPLSILEDYYFPINAEGQGPTVELLPGGSELGTINDLLYFNNQLIRGLGVPSSYMPTGPEDGQAIYNDGKAGLSYIQEFRFSKFCNRIQRVLVNYFDYEFKLFIKRSGIVIESSQFNVNLVEPESFSDYKAIEKDNATMGNLSQALSTPMISRRFALKKYGKWSESEILENEKLWREENKKQLKGAAKMMDQMGGEASLRHVGITPPTAGFGGGPGPESEPEINTEQEGGEGAFEAAESGVAPGGVTPTVPAAPTGI